MSGAITFLLAVSLQFHGVVGQSAAATESPLTFTGVRSLVELPGERVLFVGDDGRLYEILDGRPVATGKSVYGSFLDFDGKTLRALDRYWGVWEIDLNTLEPRQTIGPNGVRWDLAGVRPETLGHPFAEKCKFVTWDPKRDMMVAYDASGREKGELFPLPPRKDNCRIESFGFLPSSGDLAMATYWPDLKIYRFRPDGTQVVGDGWPIRRGFGFLRRSGGELFHCTGGVVPVRENMVYAKSVSAPPESQVVGYARQNGRQWLGTSQGLYVKEPGELGFNRRYGGIGRLTALAVHGGFIWMSMGEKIRWMRLDGDEHEPFASSDRLEMRIDNGKNWTDRILDLAPDGEGWLKVATGNAGLWRFRPTPPVEYVNHLKYWIRFSKESCEKATTRKPSEKLMKMLSAAQVPGGMTVGKIAADGNWLVVEDQKNFRLVRFRINR